jgi:hypothetical protein
MNRLCSTLPTERFWFVAVNKLTGS